MNQSVEKLNEHILLVDDEPGLLDVVDGLIQGQLGYSCIKANSGREALGLIDSAPIFLAILDIRMPGMDGFELAREIIRTRPSIPCVFLSGFADRDAAIDSLKIGIRDILDKPLDMDKVTATIERFAQERFAHIIEEREMAAQVRATFLDEAGVILRDLDDMVVALEDPVRAADYAQLIFRRIHTIKGSSGAVEGASTITRVAHAFESALSPYRDGRTILPAAVLDAMLRAVDLLKAFVQQADLGASQSERVTAVTSQLEQSRTHDPSQTAAPPQGDTKVSSGIEERDEGVMVDNAKLDRFMSLAGDLVVFKNNFLTATRQSGHVMTGLDDIDKSLQKLSDDLQAQIMDVRKVRLERVLGKIPRIVRQTTQQLSKKIRLNMEGSSLEVDKNLAAALSASLTHMVRNSCDHGIESPNTRSAAGKPSEGQLDIKADVTGGLFSVSISDDGAGMDPERLRQKAINSGILTEDQANRLSDQDTYGLIFRSGFSTSEKVTQVSGRGVGMDAVKAAMDKIGGRIEVESSMGKGSTFFLRMPIPRTVVIERAILAACGNIQVAVPLDSIAEVRALTPTEFVCYEHRMAISHRGKMVSIGSLADFLDPNRPDGWSRPTRPETAVIMRHKDRLLAMRLDRILDQIEAVVRPFDGTLGKMPGFKGVISSANGNLAYVVSVEELMDMMGCYTPPATSDASETPQRGF